MDFLKRYVQQAKCLHCFIEEGKIGFLSVLVCIAMALNEEAEASDFGNGIEI